MELRLEQARYRSDHGELRGQSHDIEKSCATMVAKFSVHNLKTRHNSHRYGIQQLDILSVRHRLAAPPGYAPHSQNQLKQLLHCFKLERSVLLADSRLELLLHASL